MTLQHFLMFLLFSVHWDTMFLLVILILLCLAFYIPLFYACSDLYTNALLIFSGSFFTSSAFGEDRCHCDLKSKGLLSLSTQSQPVTGPHAPLT